MKHDLYAEVSARIIAELEAGVAHWLKPWSATPGANTPCNAVGNRPYSGCNDVVLLWMVQAIPLRGVGRGRGPGGYFWAIEQIVWMLNGKRFGLGSAVCSQGHVVVSPTSCCRGEPPAA